MKQTTIQESFTLPSKGLLYSEQFNPKVTLRSMTTEEEMKRLSYSDSEYELLAGIIDDCILEELPISSYDMCIGDYEFLLHKLRIVSYGNEYKMVIQCPNCNQIVKSSVDLDLEEVHEFDPEVGLDNEIELPLTKKKVKLGLQTPRMLDSIAEKAKEQKKKSKTSTNYEFLYTVMSLIKEVDGKKMNDLNLEPFVRSLPIKDATYIVQKGAELNRKVGLDTSVIAKCPECGYEVVTNFRIQSEFFGPEIN